MDNSRAQETAGRLWKWSYEITLAFFEMNLWLETSDVCVASETDDKKDHDQWIVR